MKKLLAVLLFGGVCSICLAQQFVYDAGFYYLFDNAEYTPSKGVFQPSGTLHLSDLRLQAGLGAKTGKAAHTVLAGFDVAKNMGEQNDAHLPVELLLSYRTDIKTTYGQFSAVFGCFPRTFSEGYYNEALFSREKYSTDRNFEGMFFKYREKCFYGEIGLDCLGMYGETRRERFQIMSAGEYSPAKGLYLCWDASMYHFACSVQTPNVVDNMMAHAYVSYRPDWFFTKSSISLGWIQKYDWDRAFPGTQFYNGGMLANLKLEKWNAGIDNDFYLGQDLMPLFSCSCNDIPYKTDLYFGNLFYHTHIDGFSFYDMLELYYAPAITPWMDLKVSAVIHLGNPTQVFPVIRGWQQILSLRVNLSKLHISK